MIIKVYLNFSLYDMISFLEGKVVHRQQTSDCCYSSDKLRESSDPKKSCRQSKSSLNHFCKNFYS